MAAAQQLRLVTVLFLDITGSTALVEKLDPEDAAEVMDGALARFTAVVAQHGGRVLQYAGDNLLAVFGADAAHEDDAERALHCGLALAEAGRREGDAVRRRHGYPHFGVRVGVHTGPVLLGSGARGLDADGAIRGLTVHVAARMEQTAPPGGLRISHATWRHVEGLFDATPQPAMEVKGVTAPVKSWIVERARPGAVRARGIEGFVPPFQGREAEMEALAVMHEGAASGEPRAVTIVAEAGVGKSRLLDQWQDSRAAQGQAPLLLARLQAPARLESHALLRRWLLGFARVADGDSAQAAREGLQAAMAGRIDEAGCHALGQLIGLDYGASPHLATLPPRAVRDLGLAAFRAFLHAMAAERAAERENGDTHDSGTLLLLADDLHDADDASLELLPQLMTLPLPLMAVFGARPVLLEDRPAWAPLAAQARHRVLRLAPLDVEAGRSLALALTARAEGDPGREALVALLVAQAEGNPYYMEELTKMLLDDAVVSVDEASGRWRVDAARLSAARLPGTLNGVLQARLDGLPDIERHSLQQASIVGAVFWRDALATLDARAPEPLPTLEEKQLVHSHAHSAFEGTSEHRFAHHLLHQATYDTVLKPARRAGHAAVARWLAARLKDRAGEHHARTAGHYRLAGEMAEAARWMVQATEHAAARFDNRTVIAQANETLAMLDAAAEPAPDLPALRWRALAAATRASYHLNDATTMQAFTDQLSALAAAPGATDLQRGWAAIFQSALAQRVSRYDEGVAASTGVLQLALRYPGDAAMQELEAEAENHLLNLHRLRGDLPAATRHGLRALELARAQGLRLLALRAELNLATIDFALGRGDVAGRRFRACIETARAMGDRSTLLPLHINVAACSSMLGDFAAAEASARSAEALALELGDAVHVHTSRLNLAEAMRGQGRLGEARAMATAAAEALEAAGAPYYARTAWRLVADIEVERGDGDGVARAGERTRAAARTNGETEEQIALDPEPAMAALLRGQRAEAAAAVEPVVAGMLRQAASAPAELGVGDLRNAGYAHRVLQMLGDPRAAAVRQQALGLLRDMLAAIEDPAWRRPMLVQYGGLTLLEAAGVGVDEFLASVPAGPGGAG
jgi:class 3 adenylate cyclase/tetratricopeptide (TPR) repeat protein